MAGNPFPTIQISKSPTDQEINRIQANVSKAISSINGPFIGGNLLTGISLKANTPASISHKLARQPQIWVVCDLTGASAPSAAPSFSPNPYTPAGTISGSTFTGTPQTFSLSTSVRTPVIWRTAWDDNSITLEAGADCTISLWVN